MGQMTSGIGRGVPGSKRPGAVHRVGHRARRRSRRRPARSHASSVGPGMDSGGMGWWRTGGTGWRTATARRVENGGEGGRDDAAADRGGDEIDPDLLKGRSNGSDTCLARGVRLNDQ